MKIGKRLKLSWRWPSGKADHVYVSTGILYTFAQALARDSRPYEIRVNGFPYAEYVRGKGGTSLTHHTTEIGAAMIEIVKEAEREEEGLT